MRRSMPARKNAPRFDVGPVAIWLLAFGVVAYLGLSGGGYDPLVHHQVGIAAWWLILAAVAVGALPRRRPDTLAWVAIGLMAAFVAWTALSWEWTESTSRTSADVARLCGYLGIFALAVFADAGRRAERLVGAVAAGVALVALVALLSRLHPTWFADADQTALFITDSRERLSYPINYWNGLGGLIAIGIPLMLQVATGARAVVVRGLAAATLPAMTLAMFFTLSRGGIAAAAIATAVFLAFAGDRFPKLLCTLLAGSGAALLILLASGRDALQEGLTGPLARQQGDDLLLLTLVICLLVGLVQAAISYGLLNERRPRWTFVSRRASVAATVALAAFALIFAVALDAPGRASDGWREFKEGGGPGSGTGRLGSVAGESRYELWKAALDQNATNPLLGTGSGTYELWWARHGETGESVRDTHSLYLQTLGELGVVGFLVLAAFLAAVFVGAGRGLIRAGPAQRAPIAAALAGSIAFCLTAAVDWMWQIPVLAVAMLLIAAVLVTSDASPEDDSRRRPLGLPVRLGFIAVSLLAIILISIPLATAALLRDSEAEARDGDLGAALSAARTAGDVEPQAAPPRLQQALILEEAGDLGPAAEAARAAIEREPASWRNWLVLSRIEAELGRVNASLEAYREARRRNPESPVFDR
jgi:O-antigen ligase